MFRIIYEKRKELESTSLMWVSLVYNSVNTLNYLASNQSAHLHFRNMCIIIIIFIFREATKFGVKISLPCVMSNFCLPV